MMIEESMSTTSIDDPRKLSALLARVADLAHTHHVGSVIIGISAQSGDLMFPEFVEFLRSALRVEDAIFRMTRERAIIHLADLELVGGKSVFGRLLDDFLEEFPATKEPDFKITFFEVSAGVEKLKNKDVLTEIFPQRLLH
jgi:GGDEF domain-containing protein